MKKINNGGFTIIELFIIVILIGVVAVFIISELSSVRRDNRNGEREDDVNALRSSLEYYYGVNGFYPTFDQMNDSNFRETNLPGLVDDLVEDPLDSSGGQLVLVPAEGAYSYETTQSKDGQPCDNTKIFCTTYTLSATFEGNDIFERTNFN